MGYGPVIDTLVSSGRLDVLQVQGLSVDGDKPPEQQLLESGVLTTKDILDALSEAYGVPAVLLAEEEIDPEAVGLVPQDMALNCKVLPLRRMPDRIVLAMVDPTDVVAEDFVRFVTGFDIERVAAMPYELQQEINKRFKPTNSANEAKMMSALEELAIKQEEKEKAAAVATGDVQEEENSEKEKEASNAAPVVKAVHSLLSEGVLQKASDIHFEPVTTGLRVRYRIDGHLREITELPRMVQPMVLSRIKLQSGMDISEKRRPQDGRTRLQVGDREIDFRVSSLPTFYGEKIVMRILDSKKAAVELEVMGWSERDLSAFLDFIRMPQGAILITGPTGSGKTSTLYAALARIHQPNINIVTVEDPVEFQISGINQVQVNNKAGLTFAAALRSILRQDPNVVMLGEIRDSETANIAFEAAMTGHLVLSTLHTNDAPSALSRLVHVGVPNYMVAASLTGVVAQRLVRKLCQECKTQGPLSPEFRDILSRSGLKELPDMTWLPGGCKACNNCGYKGRMGIFEVLRVTEQIKACIYREASEQEIKDVARHQGMNTLLEDGLRKAGMGLTSIEEVLSVAPAGTEAGGDEGDEVPAPARSSSSGHGGGGHGGHGKSAPQRPAAPERPAGNGVALPQMFFLQLPNGQTLPLTAFPVGEGQTVLQLPVMPQVGDPAAASPTTPVAPPVAVSPPGVTPPPGMGQAVPPAMPKVPQPGKIPQPTKLAPPPVKMMPPPRQKAGPLPGSTPLGADDHIPAELGLFADGEAPADAPPAGEEPAGDTACVCGNIVPAGQPFCDLCGNILDVKKPSAPARATPAGGPRPAAPPVPRPAPAPRTPQRLQKPQQGAAPPQMRPPTGMPQMRSPQHLPPGAAPVPRPAQVSPMGAPVQQVRATVMPNGVLQCVCGTLNPPGSRQCNGCKGILNTGQTPGPPH